jgi:phosphoglycolate phosphatase-like HAD superfamily hydrolase
VSDPPAGVEVVNPRARRGSFRAAVFDFDGTVSLIREGWAGVMADLGIDLLREQNLLDGPADPVRAYLEDRMLRLSGEPSIYQMRRLAEEVQARGGVPGDPEAYLREYLRRLFAAADVRKARLASGEASPAEWVVPGTHALLDNLRRRGVVLYLASGTDLKYVRQEAGLLKLTEFFGDRVYAPADDTPNFSKRDVVALILRETGIAGDELLGFGDGATETVEVKRAGGVAVGVASAEAGVPGINRMKRDMLVELGADVVVPDYAGQGQLVAWLFGEE